MKRLLAVAASLFFLAWSMLALADADRQRGVAERGARVMPFDLEQTMHVFERREDGGVQRVVVKDPGNREQIALIQAHLEEEAARFARGDFGDPARIHGTHMPGLAELSAGAKRVSVVYSALPEGGEIRYRSEDPELVAAIHRWFRAQLHDHGRHATPHAH